MFRKRKLEKLKAEIAALPFVDIANVQVAQDVIELIPSETIKSYKIVPIGFDGTTIQVAMQNPQDVHAMEALQFLASERKWKLQTVVVPVSQMTRLLRQAGTVAGEVESALAA